MQYAKPLMTITELVEMGFSRYELNEIIHDSDAPVLWSAGKGKARIITEEFDDYLKKRNAKRIVKKDAKTRIPWSQRKSHLLAQVTEKN